jgi:menaquinone-dependent protoporphyrinogen oxidase
MTAKVLVTYATHTGSTAGVAEKVAETLRQEGAEAEVMPTKSVKDLSPYDAVIVGTAIRAGRPHGRVATFLKKNSTALAELPVAYFCVCLTMIEDSEQHRSEASAYLDPLAELVEPVDRGLFGGIYAPDKLSAPVRLIMKKIAEKGGLAPGDFRDLDAVETWAKDVLPKLTR